MLNKRRRASRRRSTSDFDYLKMIKTRWLWRWVKHWKSKQVRWRRVAEGILQKFPSMEVSFAIHAVSSARENLQLRWRQKFLYSLHPRRHFFLLHQLDYETPWVDELLSTHHISSLGGDEVARRHQIDAVNCQLIVSSFGIWLPDKNNWRRNWGVWRTRTRR